MTIDSQSNRERLLGTHGMGSRRSLLRNATDEMHRELDDDVAQFDLTDPAAYRMFLEATARPLFALEQMLETGAVDRLLGDWGRRSRSNALRADLAQFDTQIAAFDLRRSTPTCAEMFGMLYVLEGSRLGARFLERRIATARDARIQRGSTYLRSNDTRAWPSFLEELESTTQVADAGEMVAGAHYAFALFIKSFAATRQLLPCDAR